MKNFSSSKVLILYISLLIATNQSIAQNNWRINSTMKLVSESINKIEKNGYIIKSLTLANNRVPDKITISSIDVHDTLFAMAIVTKETNDRDRIFAATTDFNLEIYLENFDMNTYKRTDSLLENQQKFDIIYTKDSNKYYTWNAFVAPIKKIGIGVFDYQIHLTFLSFGQFNRSSIQKSNLTFEQISKNEEMRQCILIVYSKS